MLARPAGHDPHRDDCREGRQKGPATPGEQAVSTWGAGVFMVLVGLSMPVIAGPGEGGMPWGVLAVHVALITVLSNIGKMFPVFVYRGEATLKERLVVSVAMFPRGEVGAGVLVLSLGYGVNQSMVAVGVVSLALNLALTGVFILVVKKLLR